MKRPVLRRIETQAGITILQMMWEW